MVPLIPVVKRREELSIQSIVDRVGSMTIDTIEYTNREFEAGKKILVEGDNATMLARMSLSP